MSVQPSPVHTLPTVEVPLRWADIDSMQHVNNVAFLEYANQARQRLVAGGDLEAQDACGVEVVFHRPLHLESGAVAVGHESRDGRLVQTIWDGDELAGTVTSAFAPSAAPDIGHAVSYQITPRYSDTGYIDTGYIDTGYDDTGYSDTGYSDTGCNYAGANAHIRLIKLFEYVQEARIAYVRQAIAGMMSGGFVVGTVSLSVHAPVPYRAAPYDMRVLIERLGTSSVTLHTQLTSGDSVLASSNSVLIGFDLETQKSRQFSSDERSAIERVAPASAG